MAEDSTPYQVVYDYSSVPTLKKFALNNSRVRMAMGPFGCLRGDTKIVTEEGLIPISGITYPMRVLSWNEQTNRFQLSLSGGAFPKGRDYLYRIVTQQGEFVAKGSHRILSSHGTYLQVQDLNIGDEIAVASLDLLQTNFSFFQTKRSLSVPRYSQTVVNLMESYATVARQYGQRFLTAVDTGQGLFPLQDDVPVRSQILVDLDSHMEQESLHIHSEEDDVRHGKKDSCLQSSYPLDRLDVYGEDGIYLPNDKPCFDEAQIDLQSLGMSSLHYSNQLFDPCNPPCDMRLSRILSIKKLGVKEVYWDMQVADTNNYVTEDGTIHHNSGKSSACVMEIIRRAHEMPPCRDGIRRSRWAVVRNCYDDQTEVLTEKRGWKLFKDLNREEKIASLVNGKSLEFVQPTLHYVAPYKGEMIGYKNRSIDFLVTPEHHLYASMINGRTKKMYGYKLHRAEDIYSMTHYRFKVNAEEYCGGESEYSEKMFEFFGFWFAEGYVGKYPRKDTVGFHWRLAITQKDNEKYVSDLLDACGFKYGKNKGGGSAFNYSIYITDREKALIEKLLLCGERATLKFLPEWIKNAPKEHLKAFLYGFEQGDGHTRNHKKESTRLYTSSERLANDLQEIILKTGGSASLNKSENNSGKNSFKATSPRYRLTIHQPNQYKPQTQKKSGWYKQEYDGMVYCVEVPSHVIVTRRNKKILMNSQSYGQLKDTTIKTFHDWFPPKLFGEYRITDHTYIMTKFPGVHLEVMFRALDRPDQVSNLLSLELTGAWFNEAREIAQSIIEAMDARIARYPSKRDVTADYWTGIIMDTNPPDDQSYLYRMFEVTKPKNWKIFKQPSGLSIHAENLPNLRKNYYKNLAEGKDEMYKRVYIHGQYGYIVTGKPVFQSFVDTVHVSHYPLEPTKGLDVIVGFDFGLCYDDQTEVLTSSGWKLFKDVTDEDKVFTKNFNTNIAEYKKPLKKIARWHEGEMYLYENHNVNFCITPEHILPCRKRYGKFGLVFNGEHRITAQTLFENITKHYAVDLTSQWVGNSDGKFGPIGWESSVFAEFMGLYLSEGSYDSKNSRISIAQNNQDEIFQEVLNSTELSWVRGKSSWRVTNKILNDYLSRFGHASDKYVPEEIKQMTSDDILLFIMAYTRGDGHIRKRANGSIEHTIFTVSKRMANDFQELAQKVGWYAKIRVVKPQDSVIVENGRSRTIHNDGGYSITFKKRVKVSELIKKHYKKINYSGMVYCMTVPDGTLYVRRKWTPSWNGNTPACVLAQVSPYGQLQILDEIVSDGMGLRQFCINQLLPLLRKRYFGMNVVGYGDPSGTSRMPTDESTCFELLQGSEIGLRGILPAPTNALVPRIGAVETFLNKMYKGDPGFIMSPGCRYLRKAMNGGYHYEKDRNSDGDEYKLVPVKNFSSHVSDALEYLCMYITDKEDKDKRWKEVEASIGMKRQYRPASYEAGY